MPKQKQTKRKPTSFRLTPMVAEMLADLTAIAADQTDAINVAIVNSWWQKIGQHQPVVETKANTNKKSG